MAAVRAWFGLGQAELALYLGVSAALVQAVEAGRRRFPLALVPTLLPLTHHLPIAPAPAPDPALADAPAPAPDPALADAAALAFRRRQCLVQAQRLAAELASLEANGRAATHWAAALPALRATSPPPLPGSTPAEAAARETWRQDWLSRRARPRPPAEATRAALLRARLAGLATEAAALGPA
ncbi:hypothetical protein D0T11_02205 [Hymenobacter rubripertinctus]|uniref:Uncharacterized protein n=1 Tax=Hymenobacter rubripertinctus TaxID=2029981 RepID=A0A418R7A9_9BACT|nr:hypothetical protein D0T11_02205 [Hymenobacter rubripertinctus]